MKKRWLTLKEAAHYSAIGRSRLVSMAREGKIKGFQDAESGRREWIFDIHSLDSYREGQAVQTTYKDKALAILSGVRL